MPYGKRRATKRKPTYRRKSTRRTYTGRTRGGYRRGKYTKVSRRRSSWTTGTTVSPFRKFVFNDEDYAFSLSTLSPYVWKLFRGNSCYDPDYDVGGVQPYGYDQLCPAFYQRYCVKGSKITVYPFISVNNTITPQRVKIVVVPYFDTTIPYSEYTDVIRMPGAKSSLLSYYANDNKTRKCVSYYRTASVLGKNQANDEDSSALYNANPANQWYWYVFCYTGEPVTAGDTLTIRYDVKITYYTCLSQKVSMNES